MHPTRFAVSSCETALSDSTFTLQAVSTQATNVRAAGDSYTILQPIVRPEDMKAWSGLAPLQAAETETESNVV